jgi:hypothetical protein
MKFKNSFKNILIIFNSISIKIYEFTIKIK